MTNRPPNTQRTHKEQPVHQKASTISRLAERVQQNHKKNQLEETAICNKPLTIHSATPFEIQTIENFFGELSLLHEEPDVCRPEPHRGSAPIIRVLARHGIGLLVALLSHGCQLNIHYDATTVADGGATFSPNEPSGNDSLDAIINIPSSELIGDNEFFVRNNGGTLEYGSTTTEIQVLERERLVVQRHDGAVISRSTLHLDDNSETSHVDLTKFGGPVSDCITQRLPNNSLYARYCAFDVNHDGLHDYTEEMTSEPDGRTMFKRQALTSDGLPFERDPVEIKKEDADTSLIRRDTAVVENSPQEQLGHAWIVGCDKETGQEIVAGLQDAINRIATCLMFMRPTTAERIIDHVSRIGLQISCSKPSLIDRILEGGTMGKTDPITNRITLYPSAIEDFNTHTPTSISENLIHELMHVGGESVPKIHFDILGFNKPDINDTIYSCGRFCDCNPRAEAISINSDCVNCMGSNAPASRKQLCGVTTLAVPSDVCNKENPGQECTWVAFECGGHYERTCSDPLPDYADAPPKLCRVAQRKFCDGSIDEETKGTYLCALECDSRENGTDYVHAARDCDYDPFANASIIPELQPNKLTVNTCDTQRSCESISW